MRPVNTWLTTLSKVKGDLELGSGQEYPVTDDAKLARFINDASNIIGRETNRDFVPVRETREFDAQGENITGRVLFMPIDDLAEIVTLTNGDATTISSSDYVLRPSNVYPKFGVTLKSSSGLTWVWDTDWEEAITIDGYWVNHQDWPNAWVDTNDTVQDDPLTSSSTTLTVTNTALLDERNRTRFEEGMLIRVETEYMLVVEIASATTLTVIRGVRGTTAVSHVQATPIDSFAIQGDIEQACTSLVVYLYRNAPLAGDRVQLLGSNVVIDNNILQRIADSLAVYRRAM